MAAGMRGDPASANGGSSRHSATDQSCVISIAGTPGREPIAPLLGWRN
jgi:hypothetical protein